MSYLTFPFQPVTDQEIFAALMVDGVGKPCPSGSNTYNLRGRILRSRGLSFSSPRDLQRFHAHLYRRCREMEAAGKLTRDTRYYHPWWHKAEGGAA